MIITKTPFRMSFVGGGSDLPDHYSNEPGHVVSTSINKYMYISIHKKFFNNIRINYSQTEEVSDPSKIQHPIVREVLKNMGINDSIEISSLADIPSNGSGLGSSSSYTVGLLNALHTYKQKEISKQQLAEYAFFVEHDLCKEPGGKQDQYAASFGGLNHFTFNPDGSVDVKPIMMSNARINNLSNSILMFYTGTTRKSSVPLKDVIDNINTNKVNKKILKDMSLLYVDFIEALLNGDTKNQGEILHKNWELKKSLSKIVSTDHINDFYDRALKSGATGGKLLGAGNGGFLMFIVPENKLNSVRHSLQDLKEVDFSLDTLGTQLILNDNE